MRPTRIIGLCLVAVCAMFAFSASAYATEGSLEYGKCNAGGASSLFTNSSCTKKAKPGAGKFEWEPLATTVPFKSGKEKGTGNAVLEGASGTEISCTAQVQNKEGEYGPGSHEVKNVVGEFSGCKALGAGCNSEGQLAEHINTKKLHGEAGVVKKEANEEKNVDGADLRGQENEFLAEFSCGPAPVKVKGGVVVKAEEDGKLDSNKMNNKIEVEFVAEKPGKQIPEKWTPGGHGISNSKHEEITEFLESSVAGGAFEHSGQTLTTIQETTGAKPKLELRQCAANVC